MAQLQELAIRDVQHVLSTASACRHCRPSLEGGAGILSYLVLEYTHTAASTAVRADTRLPTKKQIQESPHWLGRNRCCAKLQPFVATTELLCVGTSMLCQADLIERMRQHVLLQKTQQTGVDVQRYEARVYLTDFPETGAGRRCRLTADGRGRCMTPLTSSSAGFSSVGFSLFGEGWNDSFDCICASKAVC